MLVVNGVMLLGIFVVFIGFMEFSYWLFCFFFKVVKIFE